MPASGKNALYHDLLDACAQGGCPLCTMSLASVGRYLEEVLYENVNDPPTRDAVIAARGYCTTHSWMLRDLPSGAALGVSMFYRDVLRHVAEELAEGATRGRPQVFVTARRGASRHLLRGRNADPASAHPTPHRACPACLVRQRYERLHVEALIGQADDEPLLAAIAAAGGLCLIHLDATIQAAPTVEQVAPLLQAQRAAMLALHAELGEFIRKHDYRFGAEPIGAEGTAWQRAIVAVAGRRGIR